MSEGALGEVWDIYRGMLRRDAHQLLAWAYQDTRADLHAELDEPAITGLLAEAMKARRESPETPERYMRYYIGDQMPVSPDGQLGNARPRLDLAVIHLNSRPALLFIFEAKRLKTSGYPIGRYTGESGMGDFIECRYARACPEAAMIGLMQNRDAQYWEGELRRVLREDEASVKPRLRIRSHPMVEEVIPELGSELQSVHLRIDQSELRLFHIFLDCT